jgi:hypothetical protein
MDQQTAANCAVPEAGAARPKKSRGEVMEGIAFTYCKAATLIVLAQFIAGPKLVLSLVALGACVYYALALAAGKRDTRCILRVPAAIIVFWGLIGGVYAYLAFTGHQFPALLHLPGGG